MSGSTLLVAYYDAERWATIAALDIKRETICYIRLPSQFSGWDAHNSLAVAVSPDGLAHVAGNAHATPLLYARGYADNLSSFQISHLVGSKDEEQATYPTFLRAADGSLLFLYRNGISGNGVDIVDHWQDGAWHQLGAIFARRDGAASTSAYTSNFVRSSDGKTHVAVIWRRNPDVSSNYAVSYACTDDFVNWSDHTGRVSRGPIVPETDPIETTGQHAGLVNAARLILDPDGNPVILYPRYGTEGTDAIIAARPNGHGWLVREIAASKHRSNVSGGGAMTGLPHADVEPDGWIGRVSVSFPPNERLTMLLDLRSLDSRPDTNPKIDRSLVAPNRPIPPGLALAANISIPVLQSGFDGPLKGRLSWFGQAPDHDRPLECTKESPVACAPPPALLRWTVN